MIKVGSKYHKTNAIKTNYTRLASFYSKKEIIHFEKLG
jgi:hypothetical protein